MPLAPNALHIFHDDEHSSDYLHNHTLISQASPRVSSHQTGQTGATEVNDFDVVIVDEVHERHLVVDFVLGILREVWLGPGMDETS